MSVWAKRRETSPEHDTREQPTSLDQVVRLALLRAEADYRAARPWRRLGIAFALAFALLGWSFVLATLMI